MTVLEVLADKEYIPDIPETAFDRIALSLLEILPPGAPVTVDFGHADCPPGAALIEQIGCCWDFRKGSASIVERLSLGAANAWRIAWLCEPPASQAGPGGPVGALSDVASQPPAETGRVWFVRHPDVGLTVFPSGIDAVLHGADGAVHIPAGPIVGRLAYSPNGRRAFTPANRTYAVAHAFTGVDLLFGCMEQARMRGLPLPDYFLGDAPEKRMCQFLRHFDFDVIDNGEFGASIVSPVERVRAALLRNRDRWQPFLARANR